MASKGKGGRFQTTVLKPEGAELDPEYQKTVSDVSPSLSAAILRSLQSCFGAHGPNRRSPDSSLPGNRLTGSMCLTVIRRLRNRTNGADGCLVVEAGVRVWAVSGRVGTLLWGCTRAVATKVTPLRRLEKASVPCLPRRAYPEGELHRVRHFPETTRACCPRQSTCWHALTFRPPAAFDRADLQYLRDFNNALRYQVSWQALSAAPPGCIRSAHTRDACPQHVSASPFDLHGASALLLRLTNSRTTRPFLTCTTRTTCRTLQEVDIHDREREVWEREKAKLEAEAEAEATRALAAEAVALATGSGSGLLRRNSSTSTGTGAAGVGGLVSAGSRGLPGVASRCVGRARGRQGWGV